MNQSLLFLSITTLLAAPLVYAHDGADGIAGDEDTTCEIGAEWADHDYGPMAFGLVISGFQDSNLEDCDGDFDPLDPVDYAEEVLREDFEDDGEVNETFDFDGHSEYTRGGAWLLVNSGDGVTGGTTLCFGEGGHHPNFGPVTVSDLVLGPFVPFTVEADLVDATGLGDPCGDFQSDISTSCVGTCSVTYPAGLDGSYQVYVGFGNPGTQGHVCTPGGDCDLEVAPLRPPECSDGIDNDGDDKIDWLPLGPGDQGCEDPFDDHEADGWVHSIGDPGSGSPSDPDDNPLVQPLRCHVNAGTCNGNCAINLGKCAKGASCTVNLGECGPDVKLLPAPSPARL